MRSELTTTERYVRLITGSTRRQRTRRLIGAEGGADRGYTDDA